MSIVFYEFPCRKDVEEGTSVSIPSRIVQTAWNLRIFLVRARLLERSRCELRFPSGINETIRRVNSSINIIARAAQLINSARRIASGYRVNKVQFCQAFRLWAARLLLFAVGSESSKQSVTLYLTKASQWYAGMHSTCTPRMHRILQFVMTSPAFVSVAKLRGR